MEFMFKEQTFKWTEAIFGIGKKFAFDKVYLKPLTTVTVSF